jgi:hypothetical protein
MDTQPEHEIDPSVPVHMTRAGMLKDGQPNREWLLESVERSRRAVEQGREEMNRELLRILDEEV